MGKTRDVVKKIRDTKGIFHAKMSSIKDRNGMDLTEAEDIKKIYPGEGSMCTLEKGEIHCFGMKCPLGIANILKEISSLSHSIVFLYFFALISEEGFLMSVLAILWNSAFRWIYLSISSLPFTSLLFLAICKVSSDNCLAFFISSS